MSQGLDHQDLHHQDLQHQDLHHQDLENQGFENQGFENQGFENQGLDNQEQDDSRTADAGPSPRIAAADAPSTGDAAVDEALQTFRDRTTPADASLDEHADAGERLHQALQERLADLGD